MNALKEGMHRDVRDKLRCIERELAMRRVIYPRRIGAGKMRQEEADHEIKIMEAIRDDYRELLDDSGREVFGLG